MRRSHTQEKLRQVRESVRVVANTPRNASRLAMCYARSFLNDDDLFNCLPRSTSDAEPPINGLTEPWRVADFQRDLEAPHTVTLEVADPVDSEGPPVGFAVLDYSATDRQSINEFREICPRTQTADDEVRFHSAADRVRFNESVERGNIVYLRELVSAQSRLVTAALFTALHEDVVEGILGQPWCACVGKCLDQVTLGPYHNTVGNRRIKVLVESLGLLKIATLAHHRQLQINTSKMPRPPATTTFNTVSEENYASFEAILSFAIYLGDTRRISELSARWN